MSNQVSEVTPQQQIADLQTELRETQIQLQKLRAAAWGAADIFRREAEQDCGNGNFIATPTMVEILWAELNGIPEDLDLLRWARESELADLREENERLRSENEASDVTIRAQKAGSRYLRMLVNRVRTIVSSEDIANSKCELIAEALDDFDDGPIETTDCPECERLRVFFDRVRAEAHEDPELYGPFARLVMEFNGGTMEPTPATET